LRDLTGEFRLKFRVKHVCGRKKIRYDRDEIIATCLVKNGEFYMRSFIRHYFSLGVKHIVFLDNGSTDRTVDIAREYDRVTVLRSRLPFGKYKHAFKRYLVKRFGRGRWTLGVDIDELFDYPFSDRIPIGSFVRYLNGCGCTAVVAYMLEMFSDGPLSSLPDAAECADLKAAYPYYDISDIEICSDSILGKGFAKGTKRYCGGVHKQVFGVDDPLVELTKQPLIFCGLRVKPFITSHYSLYVKNADVTCALFHYRFTSRFSQKVAEIVRNQSHWDASGIYKQYRKKLSEDPNIVLRRASSRKIGKTGELVENGFLEVSENYKRWVDKRAKTP